MSELEPTVLTNKQAGAILYTLKLALAKEEARLAYFGPDGSDKAFGSDLRYRLLLAIDMLDRQTERADDMGG